MHGDDEAAWSERPDAVRGRLFCGEDRKTLRCSRRRRTGISFCDGRQFAALILARGIRDLALNTGWHPRNRVGARRDSKLWISRRSCRRRRRFVFSRLTSSTTFSTAIRLRPDDSLRRVRYAERRTRYREGWTFSSIYYPLLSDFDL